MLLPYASDRPPRNPPLAVVALVLLHFAVFGIIAAAIWLHKSDAAVQWYANLSLVPGSFRWYTLLTYSLLHDDAFHLSVNMLFLWVFGGSVEDALGRRRFLGLYVTAAVVAGLLQMGMTLAMGGPARTVPIVGASGAISAVVGVFAVRFYRSRIRFIGLPISVPAVMLLAFALISEMGVALWQIVTHRQGATMGNAAAHWAHIGGFIFGTVWAQVARQVRAGRHEYLASDAQMEMDIGSPLTAARRLKAVLAVQPGNLEAHAALAKASAMVGDREQSLAAYGTAIRGQIRNGDKVAAGDTYREMLGYFRDSVLDPAVQLSIAAVLEEQDDAARALVALDALSTRYPESREAEMASLRAAVVLHKRLADPERAVERLESFLDAYPRTEWRSYAEDLLRAARLARS